MLMFILPILTLALFCIKGPICRGFSTIVEVPTTDDRRQLSSIAYCVSRIAKQGLWFIVNGKLGNFKLVISNLKLYMIPIPYTLPAIRHTIYERRITSDEFRPASPEDHATPWLTTCNLRCLLSFACGRLALTCWLTGGYFNRFSNNSQQKNDQT